MKKHCKGWVAFLEAAPGRWLLGGVRRHESAPFEAASHARRWLAQAAEVNKSAVARKGVRAMHVSCSRIISKASVSGR